MRRMAINFVAAISLLICAATVVVWLRSYFVADSIEYRRQTGTYVSLHFLNSGNGHLRYQFMGIPNGHLRIEIARPNSWVREKVNPQDVSRFQWHYEYNNTERL